MDRTNWCLMLTRNNVQLSREAIESVLAQTIPVKLLVLDNGSSDGTVQLLHSMLGVDERITAMFFQPGRGVAASWNTGLSYIWEHGGEYAFVLNNDILLRKDAYELLLADGGDFVTCVGVRGQHYGEKRGGLKVFKDNKGIEVFPASANPTAKRPNPDFSAFVIRKRVWDAVGEFDENFRTAFFDDNDFHVRMYKAGFDAGCRDIPFMHYGSATIKNAPDTEARRIADQSGRNREYFKSKWGVYPATPEYAALFGQTFQPEA